MGTCEGRDGLMCLISLGALQYGSKGLYTPQGVEMVSGVLIGPMTRG